MQNENVVGAGLKEGIGARGLRMLLRIRERGKRVPTNGEEKMIGGEESTGGGRSVG